jgi:hypothetical protein
MASKSALDGWVPRPEQYGTAVKNPMKRAGDEGYVRCLHCKLFFTKLGISRHWDSCKVKNGWTPEKLKALAG